MILDRELRALFGAESEEHLQHLDEGLLRLESDPQDNATLADVFRHAHSLKGAARMLGLSEVETLAHGFEDALGAAARGQSFLAVGSVERLLGALDGMRALVAQALGDQPASVDVPALLGSLRETSAAPPPPSVAEPQTSVTEPQTSVAEPQTSAIAPPPSATASGKAADAGWSIETMRVDPAKLDGLLSMAGELVVSTSRAVRGRGELVALEELRDEWGRATSAAKRTLRELMSTPDAPGDARALRELERLVQAQSERLEQLDGALGRLGIAGGDLDRMATVVGQMEAAIRGVRLLPLATLFGLFPRTVRDLGRTANKAVRLEVEGGDTHADKRILEALKDPLMHLIRNAVDHGLESPEERAHTGKPETATLRLRGYSTAQRIVVEVEDDGRGLNAAAIRASAARKGLRSEAELDALTTREIIELIFAPGFSTRAEVSELSGRGVGLDIVRAGVARLRGTVEVESHPGRGCLFRLSLPVTLATTRVLLVRAGAGQTFGLPIEAVRGLFRLAPEDVFPFGGRDTVLWNGAPTSLARLSDVLGLPSQPQGAAPCVVLEVGQERAGLILDALLEEQEIILKPLGALADRVPHVAGATILQDGEVCLVLDAAELLHRATRGSAPQPIPAPDAPRPKSVLLVEDSITVRTQEKRILEAAGYDVTVAVDGLDGWEKLAAGSFDAVVSDIEMPRLNGLALTARIREEAQYAEMPVLLVTSLGSEADRLRGAEAGADAYIIKSAFDGNALVEALRRLA